MSAIGPIGAGPIGAGPLLMGSGVSQPISASFSSSASVTETSSAALTNYASVTLVDPLYTGVGGLLDPEVTWPFRAPQSGDTILYDPTNITVQSNSEVISTSNHCTSVVQFFDGTRWTIALLTITPNIVAYADVAAFSTAGLTTGPAPPVAQPVPVLAVASRLPSSDGKWHLRYPAGNAPLGAALSANAAASTSASAILTTSGGFVPLQHFSMEQFGVATQALVTTGGFGGNFQLNSYYSAGKTSGGYGGIVSSAQHRPTKTRSLQLSIQAGTSGNPGDGETPAGNGLWGFQIYPPATAGASQYGAQGSIWHFGCWIFIPNGTSLATTSLTDGAQKFMLNCFPSVVTGKDDVHICQNFGGLALINEFDPNAGANNSYPSTRSASNNNATIAQGQWTWIETAVLFQSNGDLAWRRFWARDQLVLQRSGRVITWLDTTGGYHTQTIGSVGNPTLPSSSAKMEFMFFLTYWNAHPAVDTTIYVDDIMTAITEANMVNVDNLGNRIMGSAAS